jgi:hypothetical protein
MVFNVLPLYPPPKGESCPTKFSLKYKFNLVHLSVGYSGEKIDDFLYSPFGGGVRGRINNRFIHIEKHDFRWR